QVYLDPGFCSLDVISAFKLGVEALKRIQKGRSTLKWPFCDQPLLGETVDQRLANIGYGSSEALKKHR
ncbi:unnamed protein product, partial [marine sediment metagenome]